MGDPDLRTAAQALDAAIDREIPHGWRKMVDDERYAVRAALAAALAVEATEPPPDTCRGPDGSNACTLPRFHEGECSRPSDQARNESGPAPDPQGADEAERIHLRDHLTDGYWHDGCKFCQRRRVEGGTGAPDEPTDDDPFKAGDKVHHRDGDAEWTLVRPSEDVSHVPGQWLVECVSPTATNPVSTWIVPADPQWMRVAPVDQFGRTLLDRLRSESQAYGDHRGAGGLCGEAADEIERWVQARAAAPASEDDELLRLRAVEAAARELSEALDAKARADAANGDHARRRQERSADAALGAWASLRVVLAASGEAAAGSPLPTPGPTREQVELVLSRHWGGDGTTRVTEATDAVMALIAGPGREPLWRGKTRGARGNVSSVETPRLPVPPGTAVRVDEDTGS